MGAYDFYKFYTSSVSDDIFRYVSHLKANSTCVIKKFTSRVQNDLVLYIWSLSCRKRSKKRKITYKGIPCSCKMRSKTNKRRLKVRKVGYKTPSNVEVNGNNLTKKCDNYRALNDHIVRSLALFAFRVWEVSEVCIADCKLAYTICCPWLDPLGFGSKFSKFFT